MRLDRVQYEAGLAQRRYEEVDPANRLVAASLEKRWNDALGRVKEVRRQMADFQRQQTRTFTPQQREQILALAGDFPRLWKSETTSAKDKKRMLRLLLDNITVERGKERDVSLHVSRGVVYYWINRDVLPTRRLGDGHPYWITLDEKKAEELQQWVQSSKRIASVAS